MKILILRYVEKSTIDFYISDDKLFILKILKDRRKLKKKKISPELPIKVILGFNSILLYLLQA